MKHARSLKQFHHRLIFPFISNNLHFDFMPLCADASMCMLWDTQGQINHWIQSISQWHYPENELRSQCAAATPSTCLCFSNNWNKQATNNDRSLYISPILISMLCDCILNCGSTDLVATVQMTCLNIENETILGYIYFFSFSCLDQFLSLQQPLLLITHQSQLL